MHSMGAMNTGEQKTMMLQLKVFVLKSELPWDIISGKDQKKTEMYFDAARSAIRKRYGMGEEVDIVIEVV